MESWPYRIRWRITGGNYKYFDVNHQGVVTLASPYGIWIELLEE